MSEDSIGSPDFSMSRMSLALASASAFWARAAASCALSSPSCCADSVVLLGRPADWTCARNASTLASASATFLRRLSISPDSHCAGAARLLLLGRLLAHQIGVGDGVGDARGELRIFRQKIDDDDARLLHRKDGEPVVIGLQHALFRRHAQRILDEAKEAEHALDQRDTADSAGSNSGQLVELELGDDFARRDRATG